MKGLYTALITPFKQNGDFDEDAFVKIINNQIEAGVDGLLILGTTGESPTLTWQEHDYVIELAVKIIKKRAHVIAGTGSNCTKEAVEHSIKAQKAGADCILQVSPYYNKPTQKGLYEHFSAIAQSVDIPVILYNIQGRCGVNIETNTLLRLAEISNIIGVKEASGDLNQIKEVVEKTPDDFLVFSGNDDQNFDIIKLGGDGAISVLSNLLPAEEKRMIDLCLEEKWTEAESEHKQLLSLARACFIETNPQPIKTLMAHLGCCEEIFRLPMTTMLRENKEELIKIWKKYQNG